MKYIVALLSFFSITLYSAESFGHRLDLLKERIAKDPQLKQKVAPIIKYAEDTCNKPLIMRLRTLDEVLNGRQNARKISAHGRTPLLVKAGRKELAETFGLGLSDVAASRMIYKELPVLAAAYRVSGKKEILDYLVKQLDEIASWRPIQRTGWSINMRTKKHSGKRDGVWLGTGYTILGVLLSLDMLPENSLPENLKNKIDAWLAYEVKLIASDWKNKVPWYVRKHASQSNQWVVPSSGLLCAASYLGKDRFPEEYKLGLKNIMDSMSKMGDDGASSEGFAYATSWTVPSLYTCAYFMNEKGDDTLISKPFCKNFPLWLAAQYQPGKYIINCFDYWGGCRNMYDRYMIENIAMLTAVSDSPYLQWIVFNQHTRIPTNAFGLICYAMPPQRMKQPPLTGTFERGRLLTWRSSWKNDASGLWLRGRDPEDFHAHYDCGHINYIKNGKLLLLEAGTTGYSDKRMMFDYKSLRGHNVLQIGDKIQNNSKSYEAPFKVAKLDASGGDVTIEATKSYAEATSYTRKIVWNAETLTATDDLKLKKPESVLIRWHLGSAVKPLIKKTDKGWSVTVKAGREILPGWYGTFYPEWGKKPDKDILYTAGMEIKITADCPVTVTAAKQVDHTFKYRKRYHEHNVITVKTEKPVKQLKTTFSIR